MAKHRIQPNKRFFMLIGAIALVVAGIILYNVLVDTRVSPRMGEMSYEHAGEGLVIRSERLYQTENYGKTVFLVSEGEHAATGAAIAEVYKWGYTDSLATELLTLQQTIMEYQRNNLIRDTLNTELSEIDAKIDEKTRQIESAVTGAAEGDVLALERELKKSMSDRSEFLRQYVVTDDQLTTYYNQETQLKTKIDNLMNVISAEADGVVSFYFDGAETVLEAGNMASLTIKDIDTVLAGQTFTSITDSSATRPLYRLVDPAEWYVMLVSDTRCDELQVGAVFDLTLRQSATPFSGTVTDARMTGGKYLYYFRITDDIGDYLNARAVDTSIKKTFSGAIVPAAAVSEKDGQKGVYIMSGTTKTFVPVTVRITQSNESLIEPVAASIIIDASTTILY